MKVRWWKWLLAVLLLGAAGAWYWQQKASREAVVDYKTATVTRGDLTQVVTANGQISPVKTVTVGSQVSGIITDIRVDFNARVTNGQGIAQIDPSTYQQYLTQSEAGLANAQAGQELAAINMRRAKELRASDLIPLSDYDKAVADLHQAEATVKTRDALLKKAQVDLERTTIYAPIDGVVISRVVEAGQPVAGSLNAPTLFTIANDLRNMRIEAMVSEADVGGVQEGQHVSFSVDAFPGRTFNGEVTQVRYAPVTNQNVVNYTTIVEVNNADLKLRPGMTANASIMIAKRSNVLRIPNAAFRFRPTEGAIVGGATNTSGADVARTASAGRGGGAGPGLAGSPAGDRLNSEERRRRFENMTPEQREQMRERMRSMGMGGGRGGGGGPEASSTRTVYLLDKEGALANEKSAVKVSGFAGLLGGGKEGPSLKAATIKTGISDGTYTEVLEGLNEGDVIIIGVNLPANAAAGARPTGGSPFGGGPFGGGNRPRPR